jgi:hypothetical protein
MALIAITREMGSLGKGIAEGVAQALGLQIVDHEVIEHLAETMGRPKSKVTHFSEGGASKFQSWSGDPIGLDLYTCEELYSLALRGNVLLRG